MATVCDYLRDDATKDALVRTKYRIMKRPKLARLVRDLIPYVDEGDTEGFMALLRPQRPAIEAALGKDADLFTLVVFDCQIDHILQKHADMRIPAKITRDTMSDFRIWTQRYRKGHGGQCGFCGTEWMLLHMSGQLYRIGRLQYRILDFPAVCEVYRRPEDGAYLIAARAEQWINEDGRLVDQEHGCVCTEYRRDGDKLLAHRVDGASGRIAERPEEMDLAGYEPALLPGDKVIDMHIPEDGKMEFAKVRESMQDALQFFKKHYPQHQYKAFHVFSWLLCPELEELIRPETNIRRFAAQFTRMSVGTGTHEYVYPWIFGFDRRMEDYRSETLRTSLQKGAAKLLDEGRWFTEASGFRLIEEA